MAIDKYWTGQGVSSTRVVYFEATADNSAVYTLTLNDADVVYTADASATVAEIIDGLLALLNADTRPEITAQTYGTDTLGADYVLSVTGPDDGTPFTYDSAATGAGALDVHSGSLDLGGSPNDWDNTANWSGNSLPVDTNNVLINDSDSDITYTLNQSAIQLASLTVGANFTGTIGRPALGADEEYWHPEYLRIDSTVINIGTGQGGGSGRIKIDGGAINATVNVYKTGSSLDAGLEAFLFKNTPGTTTVNVIGGEVGLGVLPGDACGITTLRVGPEGVVRAGLDSSLGTCTVTQSGGEILYQCGSVLAHTMTDGKTTMEGTGTCTTLTINGGEVVWNSSGTITTLKVTDGGKIDFSGDVRPVTITNCSLHSRSALHDPYSRVTFTNGFTTNGCSLKDIDIDVGTNRTFTVAAGP